MNQPHPKAVISREPEIEELDRAVARLSANADLWARTSNAERIALLTELRDGVLSVADDWVAAAARNKQIPEGSALVGEEWLSGPYAVIAACNGLMETLAALPGKSFLDQLPTREVRGRAVVRVLPHSTWDHLLLSGVKAEVWMEPGVTPENLRDKTASSYDISPSDRRGSVSLVLGAGNIAAIAPLDCFQKLFLEHRVVMLKMNPVNAYLAEFLERAMRPLVDRGWLQIVTGGVEAGEYLCNHPEVESIHITGAGASHDAIVWGVDEEGEANRLAGTPRNTREISSELGAVCPTIVVPGDWSEADIRFQAENVATQKLHNSGFNCVACQVLVLPAGWKHRARFLEAVKKALADAPPRGLYYPGADDRIDAFCARYPAAQILAGQRGGQRRVIVPLDRSGSNPFAVNNEVFAPLLSVIELDGGDAESWLRGAIRYCNEELHGTLGANILIDPRTRSGMRDSWDAMIEDLRYGCIGVNAWTGLGFLAVQTPWGAFPGHTPEHIESGRGFVHNTWMFDRPQRTVVEAPFRPFPRNLLSGSFSLLPRPPWFVSNRRADTLGELLTQFQHSPGWLKIPRIFYHALLG